jgi:site-specific DNA-cytosine methylase
VHLWENVPDLLLPSNHENLEWLLGILFQIGYVVAYGLFKSSAYGHPTRRERAYGVCLHVESFAMSIPSATALAQRILDFARSMASVDDATGIRSFLLPHTHEHIAQSLLRLQRVKAKDLERSSDDHQWRKKTKAMCDSHRINYSRLQAPAIVKDSLCFQALPLRGALNYPAHYLKPNQTTTTTSTTTVTTRTTTNTTTTPTATATTTTTAMSTARVSRSAYFSMAVCRWC